MRRMGSLSLRGRLMALFCATVGTWLAGSLLLLYLWLSHTARVEFGRRMLQVAVPVATDLATDRQAEYIAQLNIPNEYFELFDAAGRTLSRSRNLAENLPPPPEPLAAGQVRFYDRTSAEGPVRILAMPVRMGEQANVLLIAVSTTDLERWLHNLRSVFLLLLVFSLVVLALVSGWFASGSLRPISTLTRHAEHLAEEIRKPGGDTTQMRLPAELTRRRDALCRHATATVCGRRLARAADAADCPAWRNRTAAGRAAQPAGLSRGAGNHSGRARQAEPHRRGAVHADAGRCRPAPPGQGAPLSERGARRGLPAGRTPCRSQTDAHRTEPRNRTALHRG